MKLVGRYDPVDRGPDTDRIIFSAGHYSIGLWAALAEAGHLEGYDLTSYGGEGATLIEALFPRAYIDPNRHVSDMDPAVLCELRSKLPLFGSPSRNAAKSCPNGAAAALFSGPLVQLVCVNV